MDFEIETARGQGLMTLNPAESIMNNIFLSLEIPQGSCFWDPEFGSRLHELKRSKNTERTAELSRQYCEEALQWIIDAGRAKSIEVVTERDRSASPHRLKILVQAVQADGRKVSFETFQEVV